MPPLPELPHLRHLRIGARSRTLGFRSHLFPAVAVNLERLDLVLEVVVPSDPRAIFRLGASDALSTPKLRHVRLAITPYGIDRFGKAELLAHLPPSVVDLELIGYQHEGDEYQPANLSRFAAALRGKIVRLPTASRLRVIVSDVSDLEEIGLDASEGDDEDDAAMIELAAVCDGRGINFSVEDDSGMF